jgi:hypothetical protein
MDPWTDPWDPGFDAAGVPGIEKSSPRPLARGRFYRYQGVKCLSYAVFLELGEASGG